MLSSQSVYVLRPLQLLAGFELIADNDCRAESAGRVTKIRLGATSAADFTNALNLYMNSLPIAEALSRYEYGIDPGR